MGKYRNFFNITNYFVHSAVKSNISWSKIDVLATVSARIGQKIIVYRCRKIFNVKHGRRFCPIKSQISLMCPDKIRILGPKIILWHRSQIFFYNTIWIIRRCLVTVKYNYIYYNDYNYNCIVNNFYLQLFEINLELIGQCRSTNFTWVQ